MATNHQRHKQTDRQTDRQTTCRGIRAVKMSGEIAFVSSCSRNKFIQHHKHKSGSLQPGVKLDRRQLALANTGQRRAGRVGTSGILTHNNTIQRYQSLRPPTPYYITDL